jgi:cysteine desulfurase
MTLDLEDIACATGSACTTGSLEPSHVLSAMGYPTDEARAALRLSLGRSTNDADVAIAGARIPAAVRRLREGSRDPGTVAPRTSEAVAEGSTPDRRGPRP